jgi:hypothetical protein
MEVFYPDWLANPVLILKKNTSLNKACPNDPFVLPRIDQVIDSIASCDLLSFLDAYLGYHQIPLYEPDQIKTSFITPYGEGFRSIENKKISYVYEQEQPRSDLRDTKQRAGEIRSTYPCRSHSGNVQMNVVSLVVLASPPRDPIRCKRHNGRRLRALHTYSTTTTPSSSVQQGAVEW